MNTDTENLLCLRRWNIDGTDDLDNEEKNNSEEGERWSEIKMELIGDRISKKIDSPDWSDASC